MAFDVIGFYEAEANRIHELLDAADVPRIDITGPLTMAQRVEVLVRAQNDTRDILRRVQ